MKKVVLFIILFTCRSQAQEEEGYASKGARTETIFIIQNKSTEVSERIKHLKDAHSKCEQFLKKHSSSKNTHQGVTCILRTELLPPLISELEALSTALKNALELITKEIPLKESQLKEQVDYAFLLKDKIEAEITILNFTVALGRKKQALKKAQVERTKAEKIKDKAMKGAQNALRLSPKVRSSERDILKSNRTIQKLKATCIREQDTLERIKKDLKKINEELSKKELLSKETIPDDSLEYLE